MVFAISHPGRSVVGAKTQDDLVAADTELLPARMEEDMDHLPGLKKIHLMQEGELIGFFKMILKSRMYIREVELCMGEYDYKEEQMRIPGATSLHTDSTDDVARTFAQAIASSENTIGFKATIDRSRDGATFSKLMVKLANEPVDVPTEWAQDGTPQNGDDKFSPTLTMAYSGSAYALE